MKKCRLDSSDLRRVPHETNFLSAGSLEVLSIVQKSLELSRVPSPIHLSFLSSILALLIFTFNSPAQVSKGHQVLIDRGLQLQGLCVDDNYVTINTYTNANYSSFCWLNEYSVDTNGQVTATHSSRPDWMGTPPGILPWGRWVRHESLLPPHVTPYGGDETPFMSQLISLQLGDEWNLNDDTVRNRLVDWFIAVRTNWPNTLLFHNSWGSQIQDAQLHDFYTRAQPDMLSFDTYPWKSVWDSGQPNHIGAPIAGPPTGWYGDLRRYREHARGAGIPVAIYRQTFHAVQDYDQTVYRDPSRSELRLNTFAALAFNVKFILDYTYNTGANSMFVRACNWCGDSVINDSGLYAELSDVNFRARTLGKALVRLTASSTEGISGYTTSMMFVRGRDGNGVLNPLPVGFLGDLDSGAGNASHSDWVFQRNDLYLTSWAVTNKGTKNNGQPGDVILSWFKPLDESFDGPDYTNEPYLMIVNGLADPTATPADCLQEIKLNFHSSLAAVEILNPLTGVAELQNLTLTNGLRQLVLNLNGGDAVLLKFADGAPFVGVPTTPVTGAPIITIHPLSGEATLGSHETFVVRAAGSSELAYQWQFNGIDIPGATANNYTRSNIQFTNAGTYSVIVSNSFGTVTSSPAALTVLSGQPFFYEPFDYSNVGSPVSSNTPANWTYGGVGTNDLNVTAGNLSYSGLMASTGNSVTNGGVGLGVRRLFGTNISNGTVYFSALFRINALGYGVWNGASTQVGALTDVTNTNFRLAIIIKSNSPSGYVLGVQKGGAGVTPTFHTAEYHAGETLLLAGKYDFTVSPNSVTLWINPEASTLGAMTAPATGSVTATTGTDGFVIDRFNIRQNTAVSIPAAIQWDELRLGNSWSDVTPPAAPTPTLLTNLVRLPNGDFQFSYSSSNIQSFSVYASPNIADAPENWTYLGAPTLVSPGVYQFTDTNATNQVRRFYQLRWP